MTNVPNSTRVQAPDPRPNVDASSSHTRTNDSVSLNPTGKDKLDSQNSRAKNKQFLKCTKHTNIATMNVRTLRKKQKRIEVIDNMNRQKISILAIIDHKICHEDIINYEQLDKHIIITSSAWRNSSNAAAGGVGIIINNNAEGMLAEVSKFNDRILIVHFSGNPMTSIIIHYSPCEGSEDAEEHYSNLTAATASIPKHNTILVMGDFNAHLGNDDAHFTYHQDTNKNGHLMIDYLQESNLMVGNTNFRKKRNKLWTFISDMSGAKTQVDYILINRKWKNSMKNCEAYSTFSSVGSDHRIVTAKIKLSLRSPRASMQTRYDWSALQNPETLEKYNVTVRNRYQALTDSLENPTATEDYASFVEAHSEAASEHIPPILPKKSKRISEDPRIIAARKEVNTSFEKYASTSSNEDQIILQHNKSLLHTTYDTIQEEELNELIRKVESADTKSKHGKSWQLINRITGRKNAKRGILKGTSKAERLQKWHDYFKGLLGDEPTITDPDGEVKTIFEEHDIPTTPFTIEEYNKVKKKIVSGKAAGPDGIPPEVFKLANVDDIMLKFANNLLTKLDKPEQWSINHIQPIPKSGDLSYEGNYRGIALSSIALKITNKMILNRIQPVLDPLLRPNQNGFRPGRSTTAHILALRRVIEGVRSHNQKAIIVFVDFKKAFDSIHRGKMMEIVRKYGVPSKLVDAIDQLYKETYASVLSPDGLTEKFEIKAGVLQGDTLAPYLFAIVVDYAMREAIKNDEQNLGFQITPRKSSRHPAITSNGHDVCR